ncbi:MAG: HAD-IIIA family hydrolase [Spongiibacteraceae bacterium]
MLYIFDWDGTLLDSTGKIIRCMQSAIIELGLPEREDHQVKNIIGLGLEEAVSCLFPAISAPASVKLRETYSQHFIAADQTPCHFYPHVQSVLQQLRSQGHQLAVATGKSRRGLDRVLTSLQMQHFFDGSRCADETASKPNPLMLEQLLEQFQTDIGDAVMVGDTEFDLEMAANLGMKRIGVSYGAHSIDRLERHAPELIMDTFDQLLHWRGAGG